MGFRSGRARGRGGLLPRSRWRARRPGGTRCRGGDGRPGVSPSPSRLDHRSQPRSPRWSSTRWLALVTSSTSHTSAADSPSSRVGPRLGAGWRAAGRASRTDARRPGGHPGDHSRHRHTPPAPGAVRSETGGVDAGQRPGSGDARRSRWPTLRARLTRMRNCHVFSDERPSKRWMPRTSRARSPGRPPRRRRASARSSWPAPPSPGAGRRLTRKASSSPACSRLTSSASSSTVQERRGEGRLVICPGVAAYRGEAGVRSALRTTSDCR